MRRISGTLLIAALMGCGEAQVTPPREALANRTLSPPYQITTLASLGGTQSRGMGINNRGARCCQ